MGNRLLGIFGNDTLLGRMMNRVWIVVVGNLLFLFFSIPIVTIGASWCGLSYLMLKAHKDDGEVSVFKTFWKGFKENFVKGTIAWIVIALLAVFGYADIRICNEAGSPIDLFRYPILAMGALLLILALYLFPVIASFENRMKMLVINACYFAFRNPVKALLLAALHGICAYLTYLSDTTMAIGAFIWFFFGFGVLSYITTGTLVKDFLAVMQKNDVSG